MKSIYNSALQSLPLLSQGKVRDIYDIDSNHLLIVTTDRISAFDKILPNPIPGKGKLLTEMAIFWMKKCSKILPTQLTDNLIPADVLTPKELSEIDGRAMVVKKLKALPVESIVRGYILGSGWKEYKNVGAISGVKLPKNLQKAQKLSEAIFTPSTKAISGKHDENISYQGVVDLIGKEYTMEIKNYSLQIYKMAYDYAISRGIIIADTKLEFGIDNNGIIHLIDEALTPDSSRFWSVETYEVGKNPESFDKQYIRDYLESLNWNKNHSIPELPQEIIQKTIDKYRQASLRLIGT